MLFMCVYTWKPEKTDKVIKCRITQKIPKGLKIISEYMDLGGNRSFTLFEANDPKDILSVGGPWRGIGSSDLISVMETEKVLKLVSGR